MRHNVVDSAFFIQVTLITKSTWNYNKIQNWNDIREIDLIICPISMEVTFRTFKKTKTKGIKLATPLGTFHNPIFIINWKKKYVVLNSEKIVSVCLPVTY